MGTAGRVLGTGIGTGAASLAQDQLARSHGSTEPIDLNRAVIAAGGGATGEWLLGVLGPKVWQTAKSVFGNGALYKPGAGLTDSGRAILRDAGIDPNSIPPELGADLQGIFRQTDDFPSALRQFRSEEHTSE